MRSRLSYRLPPISPAPLVKALLTLRTQQALFDQMRKMEAEAESLGCQVVADPAL